VPLNLQGGVVPREPRLAFDSADTSAAHEVPAHGLRMFGPFAKDLPRISVGLIAPFSRMPILRKIVQTLNSGGKYFVGGMARHFRTELIVELEEEAAGFSIGDYEAAVNRLLKRSDPRKLGVVVVYVPHTDRFLGNTPYYRTKASLAFNGYPSQMVTENTLANLDWAYLNLASGIFSKAGGVPWVLESQMENADMILGLAPSEPVSSKRRVGFHNRYVGFANVFDKFGRWMFFEGTARAYEKGRTADQLRELLGGAIDKYRASKGQLPRTVVIHYWKRFSRAEREVATRLLTEQVSGVKVAFVSISDSHPFRLYATSTPDGSFPRGSYAWLNRNEILLSTTGHTEVAGRRAGTPVMLRLVSPFQHPRVFLQMPTLAEQVLGLTKLNWATVMPINREPVTLSYSRNLAYMTATVSEEEWSGIAESNVNPILNTRPWFI
jgi:hypothetical protein